MTIIALCICIGAELPIWDAQLRPSNEERLTMTYYALGWRAYQGQVGHQWQSGLPDEKAQFYFRRAWEIDGDPRGAAMLGYATGEYAPLRSAADSGIVLAVAWLSYGHLSGAWGNVDNQSDYAWTIIGRQIAPRRNLWADAGQIRRSLTEAQATEAESWAAAWLAQRQN